MQQELRGGAVFFWGRERTCVEESVLEFSLERGGHLGNTEEGKGRWAFQADITNTSKSTGVRNPEAQSWESLNDNLRVTLSEEGTSASKAHTLRVDGENHRVSGGSLRYRLHGLV